MTGTGKAGAVVLIAAAYFLAARAGLYFAIVNASITALWPPSGIALACLCLLGGWTCPGVFLGAFAANLVQGTPVPVCAGIAAGNTIAAWFGSRLCCRLKDFRRDFSRIRDVLAFGFVAALDPLISATVGVLSLRLGGLLAPHAMVDGWLGWWSGDAIGIIIVTPPILLLSLRPWRCPPLPKMLEGLAFLAACLAAASFVFSNNEMYIFLVYPVSVWAAIRFRHLGVMALSLVLACVSIPLLVTRVGPGAHLAKDELLFLVYRLQLFLSTSGLAGMLLAADITARRRTERDLAEKNERLRLIVGNTPDHILIQDRDLRYQFVANPQLGLRIEDMLGKTDHDFLSPADAGRLAGIKRRVIETGEAARVEVPLRSKTGEQEYFDGSYVPKRDEHGNIDGLIGYFRNVTERIKAEKDRLALAESEKTNRAKDQFIATLSHELRTPLTSILAWVQLIKSGSLDEETRKSGILAIEDSALTQNRLINDLLDVSRIVTGKLVLKPERIDVCSVILSAIDAIRPTAEKKAIQLSESHEPGSFVAKADPTRLKQIFGNLLSNAVKFTPPGGRIDAVLDQVEGPAGRRIRVRVIDNGEGLLPEIIPTLFRCFVQGDSSLTRGHGGMGLGLSLSRSLLELQGGDISASSNGRGKGSTFTVTIPSLSETLLAPGPAVAESALTLPVTGSLAGVTILFVDDDANTREAIRAALAASGANVRVASSAGEAVALLSALTPDLFLSDVSMPDVDGLSLLRAVRSSSRHRDLPAVALTAFAGPEVAKLTSEAGFDAHLTKPVLIEQLVTTIRDILRGAAQDRPLSPGNSP